MTQNKLKRQECEVWSRCVGYMRPVKQFNDSKRAEYADRVNYKIKYD